MLTLAIPMIYDKDANLDFVQLGVKLGLRTTNRKKSKKDDDTPPEPVVIKREYREVGIQKEIREPIPRRPFTHYNDVCRDFELSSSSTKLPQETPENKIIIAAPIRLVSTPVERTPEPAPFVMWFPEDVLHTLFNILLPETDMVGGARDCGKTVRKPCQLCDILKMKRTLVLVCKAWNFIALPYMYREVILGQAAQLRLLSRTVIIRPSIFGKLIRRVTLGCYLPASLSKDVQHQINDLLKYAPNIEHISFEGFCSNGIFDSRNTSMMAHEHAAVGYDAPRGCIFLYDASHSRMRLPMPPRTCATLRTAGLPLAAQDVTPYTKNLDFPNLERLSFIASPLGSPDRSRRYWYPQGKWTLPVLKDLRFRPCAFPSLPLNEFLKSLADQLVTLDLGRNERNSWAGVVRAMKCCPNLRHVVFALDHNERCRPIEPDAFAGLTQLEVIDIIVVSPKDELHRLQYTAIPANGNIRAVRYFERFMMKHVPDLPHFSPLNWNYFDVGTKSSLECYGYRVWAECQALEGLLDVREMYIYGVPKPTPEPKFWDHGMFRHKGGPGPSFEREREREMYYQMRRRETDSDYD